MVVMRAEGRADARKEEGKAGKSRKGREDKKVGWAWYARMSGHKVERRRRVSFLFDRLKEGEYIPWFRVVKRGIRNRLEQEDMRGLDFVAAVATVGSRRHWYRASAHHNLATFVRRIKSKSFRKY